MSYVLKNVNIEQLLIVHNELIHTGTVNAIKHWLIVIEKSNKYIKEKKKKKGMLQRKTQT